MHGNVAEGEALDFEPEDKDAIADEDAFLKLKSAITSGASSSFSARKKPKGLTLGLVVKNWISHQHNHTKIVIIDGLGNKSARNKTTNPLTIEVIMQEESTI